MTIPVIIQIEIGSHVREVDYEPGESLLDCAIRNDLNPPYSCMEGVCLACQAQVLEGAVEHPEDTILDENDISSGRILTCQAKPKSGCARLKISYDAV